MKWYIQSAFLALTIPFICHSAAAAPILALTTSADLASGNVGETLTLSVELSGLDAGQELDSLAATVSFDGSLLGTPVISAGPIVPNPLDDPLDLLVTEAAGLGDVAFLTFGLESVDHIATNGVFFSFEVTPVSMGAGIIDFDFVGATLFNAANPNNPTVVTVDTGPPLSFVVVPEPNSFALAVMVVLGLAVRRCGGTGNS